MSVYLFQAQLTTVVVSDTEEKARDIANKNIDRAYYDSEIVFTSGREVHTLKEIRAIDPGWDALSCPFGTTKKLGKLLQEGAE